MRRMIEEFIEREYGAKAEYLWRNYPEYAVFRHGDNNKWFAVIMRVQYKKIGMYSEEYVDVIDLKIDDMFFRDTLLKEEGIYPGYHMNKVNWITVVLDGSVDYKKVCNLIEESYVATASKPKKEEMRAPKDWIIPSNPKYYDVIKAFEEADEINWKQGRGIKKGDIVYLYVGAPVAAILYQCQVTETDIPYEFNNGKLTINSLMKIKLLKTYAGNKFTFKKLKEKYGILAIRGPRGLTNSLKAALERVK